MRKIRIIHVEDWFHPEMGYQLNYFAKYHADIFEMIILTSNSLSNWSVDNSDLPELDSKFKQKYNVQIIRLPVTVRKNSKHFLWLNGLISKLEENHPDIIYLHGIETISSIRVLRKKRFLKKAIVFADTHTLLSQLKENFVSKIYFSLFKTFIVRNVNRFLVRTFATAPENYRILQSFYGISDELIENSAIGADSSVFWPDKNEGSLLRDALNIKLGAKVLIYTGKLNASKRPHLILEAIKRIENEINVKLTLVFVGSKDESYYNKYFNIEFSNPNVKILIVDVVKNTELYKYYSMADFAVFPAESTLSALDAQLCELPVIMEEDDTNLLRLKEGGLTYKKGNVEDLADKILNLLKNKEIFEELKKKGRDYVLENFEYKKIVEKTEKIILDIYSER